MKKNIRLLAGFTLVETMMALVILGVVALLVIPVLINDIQDMDLKIQWRKDFSDLTQVAYRIISDYNGTFVNVCANLDSNCVRDKFAKYLEISKSCDGGPNATDGNTLGNCWHRSGVLALNGWQKAGYSPQNQFAGVILNNGGYLMFTHYKKACDARNYSNIFNECGLVFVDVNGARPPNTIGRDIFHMKFAYDGLVPFGVQGDDYFNDCNPSNKAIDAFGFGCAARYLSQ